MILFCKTNHCFSKWFVSLVNWLKSVMISDENAFGKHSLFLGVLVDC